MVKVQDMDLPPAWLRALLTKKLYDNMCRIHTNQYERYFCKKCMNECLCYKCLSNTEHVHHETTQVFRASGHASIEVDELKKIWRSNKIQPFKINNRMVFYLHQRDTKGTPGCRICNGLLLDKTKTKIDLCSIQCQINDIMNIHNAGGQLAEVVKEKAYGKTIMSIRRDRRKGIPRRSPFL